MKDLKPNYQTLVYKVNDPQNLSVRDILGKQMGVSSRLVKKLKTSADITVNGRAISLGAKVRSGDVIALYMREEKHNILPENIKIDVVYEDDDIVAVNKAVGIVAHPTAGVPNGTLSNAVRHYALSKKEDYKPRLINRLDRDTSGIILFAKNPHAQHFVSQVFQAGQVEKFYLTLVHGVLDKECLIDAPIGLKFGSKIKRTVTDDGKNARTKYWVKEKLKDASLLRVQLLTGRTHQIRVHMNYIGHPIIGDTLYGDTDDANIISRQALHAHEMRFLTPRSGAISITAALPSDIQSALELLKV